jgi:uncharacterized membrane protein
MQPKLTRNELDRIAEQYRLDSRGVDALLEVSQARPSAPQTARFLARLLGIGGLISVAASVVFFVAANWSRLAVFGRFGLLEILLLGCAIAAILKPPPATLGRAALFLAFVTTGALLALFGQTYQTGADVYELFLTWALLGLPLAILGNWSVTSAAWLLVFNLALMLFCGFNPVGGLLWAVFGGQPRQPALLLLAATWLNVILWLAFEQRRVEAVPGWVRRLAISCAFGFGTWAAILGIVDSPSSAIAVAGVLLAMALVGFHAHGKRRDIYPLAVVMGTGIIIGIAFFVEVSDLKEEGILLVLALWLIGSSAFAAKFLASTARDWRTGGAS